MNLTELREIANKLAHEYEGAEMLAVLEKQELANAKVKYGNEQQAQEIIQGVAQQVQQQAHDKIAAVVSKCLSAVFAEPYQFTIRFDRKRGKTEAVLTFMKGDNEVSPTFGSGGGVLDVAAFALRLACLSLTQPPLRKLLVLDEPFGNVHGEENRERTRELVETLPRELGVQIILVTGLDWLTCGKVVRM